MGEAQKRWYRDNREDQIRQAMARNDIQRMQIRALIMKERAKGCERCGFNHPAAIDFHHPGEKNINISRACRDGWSLKRVLEELKLCIRLCANCHRIEHYSLK